MSYNPSIHQQLLQIKSGIRVPEVGICCNLKIFSDYGTKRLHKAIMSWPLRKGTGHLWPVEGTRYKYCKSSGNYSLWSNPRRIKLLDYLIEYYKPKGRNEETILIKDKISKSLLK
jgi:hypothetical protein